MLTAQPTDSFAVHGWVAETRRQREKHLSHPSSKAYRSLTSTDIGQVDEVQGWCGEKTRLVLVPFLGGDTPQSATKLVALSKVSSSGTTMCDHTIGGRNKWVSSSSFVGYLSLRRRCSDRDRGIPSERERETQKKLAAVQQRWSLLVEETPHLPPFSEDDQGGRMESPPPWGFRGGSASTSAQCCQVVLAHHERNRPPSCFVGSCLCTGRRSSRQSIELLISLMTRTEAGTHVFRKPNWTPRRYRPATSGTSPGCLPPLWSVQCAKSQPQS